MSDRGVVHEQLSERGGTKALDGVARQEDGGVAVGLAEEGCNGSAGVRAQPLLTHVKCCTLINN